MSLNKDIIYGIGSLADVDRDHTFKVKIFTSPDKVENKWVYFYFPDESFETVWHQIYMAVRVREKNKW